MTYSDTVEENLNLSGKQDEEKLDGSEALEKAMELLSENDWTSSADKIKPIRNNLCSLLGINPPQLKVTLPAASDALAKPKEAEAESQP